MSSDQGKGMRWMEAVIGGMLSGFLPINVPAGFGGADSKRLFPTGVYAALGFSAKGRSTAYT